MNVDESYTEVVSKARRSPTSLDRTREPISLGRDAIISGVNDIASPCFVNNHGIAIINYRQAKGSVILSQMLSEAIRFQTVLETLLGLHDDSSSPNTHRIIWEHQNEWSRLGGVIHRTFKKNLRGDEEMQILKTNYFVRVILSDTGSNSFRDLSPSTGSKRKCKLALTEKG
ncbi:hypothetical protein DM860_010036 [Cuscuta australis]|uniref:rRNA N-glycosylase n=1 Tax=Cuscuta australis TaxID=267555 RepID=A0A328D5U6_9ASTE|nr:hypothetical protein DM860_010036 [Cuscuta australis]